MNREVNYIVVSSWISFQNFERTLSILNTQKPRPLAWFIFNDSGKEIKTNELDFPVFVVTKKFKYSWYYKKLELNLNYLFKQIPKKLYDKTDYFLKIDDDTEIPDDYVEKLIPFVRDGCFGCVSGKIYSWGKNEFVLESRDSDFSLGTGMLFRKEVLDYLKEYPTVPGGDVVLNLSANFLGFKSLQVDGVKFYQHRLTCSNSGWSKPLATAVKQYYLRFPFFIICFFLFRRGLVSDWFTFYNVVKNVKDKDRLDNFDLVKVNNRRMLVYFLKKFRRLWGKWFG